MKTLLAITFASVYGLSIRLFFGFLDGIMGIMSVSFLVICPFVIGFLTVFFMPKEKITGRGTAFFMPWITSLLILIVTIAFNIEGSICWIMIYPLFAILAGIGGLIAYNIKRKKTKDPEMDIDHWKDPENKLKVSFVLFLVPLVLGFLEGDRTLAKKEMTITKSVIIPATPALIWQKLISINAIESKEKHAYLSTALGFPGHIRTTLDTLAVGGKRTAFYEKGLTFDETISKFERERLLVLEIKTDPAKIPPTVLDAHIVIGGKHVDILEDIYKIEPLADGTSRLTLSSKFIINTPFNWYAGIWADYLMADLLMGELNLVKERAATAIAPALNASEAIHQ